MSFPKIFPKEFDISKVSLVLEEKAGKKNRTEIKIDYEYREGLRKPLYVETPVLKTPFGASCFNKKELISAGYPLKYKIDLNFDESEESAQLENMLRQLQDLIVDTFSTKEKFQDILKIRTTDRNGNQKHPEEIKEMVELDCLTHLIRQPNTSFAPFFRCSFNYNSKRDEYYTKVEVDEDGNYVDLTNGNIENLFCKGSHLRCLLNLGNIWTMSGKLGVSIKLCRAKVYLFLSGDSKYQWKHDSIDDKHKDLKRRLRKEIQEEEKEKTTVEAVTKEESCN